MYTKGKLKSYPPFLDPRLPKKKERKIKDFEKRKKLLLEEEKKKRKKQKKKFDCSTNIQLISGRLLESNKDLNSSILVFLLFSFFFFLFPPNSSKVIKKEEKKKIIKMLELVKNKFLANHTSFRSSFFFFVPKTFFLLVNSAKEKRFGKP